MFLHVAARLVFLAVFLVAGSAGAQATPADRPHEFRADAPEIRNAEAYFRLLGYIRYFHPSDQAREVDWNGFAARHAERVLAARGSADLARILTEIFAPLAPTVRIHPIGAPPPPSAAATHQDQATRIIAYAWLGQDDDTDRRLPEAHRIALTLPSDPAPWTVQLDVGLPHLPSSIELDVASPQAPVVLELPGGVTARVPIAVYADDERSLSAPPDAASMSSTGTVAASALGIRLAIVGLTWTALEHHFPYWDAIQVDWDAVLPEYLARAANADGLDALMNVLEEMTALLDDGHTHTEHAIYDDDDRYFPPFTADLVEDHLTITTVRDDAGASLRPSAVILAINGEAVEQAMGRLVRRTGGNGQWRTYQVIERLLGNETGADLTITLQPFGSAEAVEMTLPTSPSNRAAAREERPPTVAALGSEVTYLDLTRASRPQVLDVTTSRRRQSALIVDLRGYPASEAAALTLLEHLATRSLHSSPMQVPFRVRPGPNALHFLDVEQEIGVPGQPRWTGEVIFLINGNRGVSFTETLVGAIIEGDLGTLVGRPTAGANGNITTLDLPAGFSTSWSGVRVLRNDGSTHFGVGFHPDHLVPRTRAGVAAGEDEILTEAYRLLTGHDTYAIRDLGNELRERRRTDDQNTVLHEVDLDGRTVLVPRDWTPTEKGILMRAPGSSDPAVMAYGTVPHTGDAALEAVLGRLRVPHDLLSFTRTRTINGHPWALHAYSVPAASLTGTVATSQIGDQTLFLAIQGSTDDYTSLYASILLAAMEHISRKQGGNP